MHRVNQDNATMITQDDERKIDRSSSIELLLSLINQYGTVERLFPSKQSATFHINSVFNELLKSGVTAWNEGLEFQRHHYKKYKSYMYEAFIQQFHFFNKMRLVMITHWVEEKQIE